MKGWLGLREWPGYVYKRTFGGRCTQARMASGTELVGLAHNPDSLVLFPVFSISLCDLGQFSSFLFFSFGCLC